MAFTASIRARGAVNLRGVVAAMLATAVMALSGCASLSPQQCRSADWRAIGLADGMAGQPLSRIDRLNKDCAEAGVAVDVPRYLEGRNAGLPQYCHLDNAVREGLAGRGYASVCAPGIDAEFRRRHAAGREVYLAREAVESLERRRQWLEDRLLEARSDSERRRIRDDLRELDWRLMRARDRVRDAERALDALR